MRASRCGGRALVPTGRSSTRRSARPSPRARRRSPATGGPARSRRRRSQISNSSSSSSLTTSTRAAGVAQRRAARRGSAPPRRRRRPRSAARRSAASASASISRPTMNFCRLPPDRLLRRRVRPAGLDVEARDQSRGQRAHAPVRDPAAARRPRSVRVSSVFCGQRQRRHRAAAEPLLGHEVQAQRAAPARRRAARRRAPNSAIEPAGARVSSPDSAAISSCWPLPETPAMPTISPARTSKRDVRPGRCRTGRRCAQRQAAHRRAPTAPAARARCCSCGGSAPIIRRDRLALLSWRRVAPRR